MENFIFCAVKLLYDKYDKIFQKLQKFDGISYIGLEGQPNNI